MFPDFLNESLRFMSVRILKLLGGRHIPPLFFRIAFDVKLTKASIRNMKNDSSLIFGFWFGGGLVLGCGG